MLNYTNCESHSRGATQAPYKKEPRQLRREAYKKEPRLLRRGLGSGRKHIRRCAGKSAKSSHFPSQ
jgi:hypothetical protein